MGVIELTAGLDVIERAAGLYFDVAAAQQTILRNQDRAVLWHGNAVVHCHHGIREKRLRIQIEVRDRADLDPCKPHIRSDGHALH